jgi:protein-disulfide isomerase
VQPEIAKPVSLEPIDLQGSGAASVILTVFSDYQCPYCGKFARETVPLIEKVYVTNGKVRIGYRYLPLESIHPFARGAAVAAECAAQQGQFWSMHGLLFDSAARLDSVALTNHAEEVGLDLTAFGACQSGDSAAKRVASDIAAARSLKISGTPAILVGRILPGNRIQYTALLRGAASFDDLAKVLDRALEPDGVSRYSLGIPAGFAIGGSILYFGVQRWRRRRA